MSAILASTLGIQSSTRKSCGRISLSNLRSRPYSSSLDLRWAPAGKLSISRRCWGVSSCQILKVVASSKGELPATSANCIQYGLLSLGRGYLEIIVLIWAIRSPGGLPWRLSLTVSGSESSQL